ncbi:2Fe-2S iron-sulfur cluster-binding protein [Streptomyces sp. NBC_01016]|uniref:2Fe-2S iron-sulfur cluster-binding protein n=1 Tax=Streptomyces sp. NBC_01016 TaxID=2903720 RepID=UPI00225C02BA|nr:2Fe-2S iron-sulfur cluster-binding protein [Streptomyces sp. NBC_01016]MCX4827332.1 2Fe-2S iron-sulfur cluster-binding protein [Streptomyces sp. NBC_01016]
MTNEYPGPDGWEPVPQGEYDSDATAFVQLPPEGFPDAAPLEAPGHGYVPPPITVSPATGAAATDPAATGVWVLPQDLVGPAASGGGVESVAAEPVEQAPHHGQTGQWSIPLAGGELPDESGEFTASTMAQQWGGHMPPATLPGGASAPWAAQPEAPAGPGVAPAVPGVEAGPSLVSPERPSEPASRGSAPDPAPQSPAGLELPDSASQASAGLDVPSADAPDPAAQSPVELDVPAAPDGHEAVAPEVPEVEVDAVPEAPEVEAEVDGAPEAPEVGVDPEVPDDEASGRPMLHDDHPLASYVLRVNGADRPVTDAWIGESLLYVLRERLGLAGAKDGCSQGECGACNVQVDGRLVASCLVPAATTAGSEVRTVEGLATDGRPSDVQRALAACGSVQCGFCVPGMAMTAHDLLEGNPNPTALETRQALCGNLCRCSGYRGVVDAVRQVADERRAAANAASEAPSAEGGAQEPLIPRQAGPLAAEDIQVDAKPQSGQARQGFQSPQGFQNPVDLPRPQGFQHPADVPRPQDFQNPQNPQDFPDGGQA